MTTVTAGGARHPIPQTEVATDGDESTGRTTTGAHGGTIMIVTALAETARRAGSLAVHLGGTASGGIETDVVESVEVDLQVPWARIAKDAQTAATGIATTMNATAVAMANDLQGNIAARDLGPGLRGDHEARGHYNEAAHSLHNPMPSPTR